MRPYSICALQDLPKNISRIEPTNIPSPTYVAIFIFEKSHYFKGNQLKFLNQHFGDWFVLHQMYKNIHLSNFTRLVSKLCAIEEKSCSLLKKGETFISFDDVDREEEIKDDEKRPKVKFEAGTYE